MKITDIIQESQNIQEFAPGSGGGGGGGHGDFGLPRPGPIRIRKIAKYANDNSYAIDYATGPGTFDTIFTGTYSPGFDWFYGHWDYVPTPAEIKGMYFLRQMNPPIKVRHDLYQDAGHEQRRKNAGISSRDQVFVDIRPAFKNKDNRLINPLIEELMRVWKDKKLLNKLLNSR